MAKRMKLISEQEYKLLKSNTKNPKFRLPCELEKSDVLETEQTGKKLLFSAIPDDIKAMLYSSIEKTVGDQIQEILHAPVKVKIEKDNSEYQKINKSEVDSSTLSKNDLFILSSIPTTAKPSAKMLMKILKKNPKLIQWDTNGTCKFFQQPQNPGSSIIDLISYVTRSLKWQQQPIGINRFLHICKSLNVPSSCLNTQLRKEWGSSSPIKPRKTKSIAQGHSQAIKQWETLGRSSRENGSSPSPSPSKEDYY